MIILTPAARSSVAETSGGDEAVDLVVAEQARAGEEPHPLAILQREHAAAARYHVDDELGVLPVFKLRWADVERRAGNLAELDVAVTHDEIVLRVAHRRRAVTAASRLMEQHRAVPLAQRFDQGFRGGCGNDLFCHGAIHQLGTPR